MKLLAVYHAGYLDSLGGARQLRRGRHLIRGGGEISGEIMAADVYKRQHYIVVWLECQPHILYI